MIGESSRIFPRAILEFLCCLTLSSYLLNLKFIDFQEDTMLLMNRRVLGSIEMQGSLECGQSR